MLLLLVPPEGVEGVFDTEPTGGITLFEREEELELERELFVERDETGALVDELGGGFGCWLLTGGLELEAKLVELTVWLVLEDTAGLLLVTEEVLEETILELACC